MSLKCEIEFTLNGKPAKAAVDPGKSALAMLRDVLGMTGTKLGCGEGECGSCTILVDGVSVNSCLMFAVDCDGRELTTIEGLGSEDGLDDLQESFAKHWAVQCGKCTPGMIMQAKYIRKRHPDLDAEAAKRGIEGNLCRCTGYVKILEAIMGGNPPDSSKGGRAG